MYAKVFSSTTSRIDWRTSTCLQKTKTSWKLTSRVGCTILEANRSDILPWRHLLKKRTHYELCALIPQVMVSKSEETTVERGQILNKKWGHLIPLPSSFKSELFRWINYWKCQAASDYESISVSTLLAKRANNIFFPNIRELKILAVLPVGSTGRRGCFLLFGGSILGFATQWPPNIYQI